MLLEPVRRHESSCVLISRVGPDPQQLHVTQTATLLAFEETGLLFCKCELEQKRHPSRDPLFAGPRAVRPL